MDHLSTLFACTPERVEFSHQIRARVNKANVPLWLLIRQVIPAGGLAV
jgi:hypothetical protein